MMGWYGYGWSGAWWGMGAMTLTWVAIIGVAVWAVLRATRDRSPIVLSMTAESAHSILDRRFAAGEISAQEYVEARRTLETHGSAPAGTA